MILSLACLTAAVLWWGWDRIGPAPPEPPDLEQMDAEVASLIGQAIAAARRHRGDEDLRMELGMVYEANELPEYARTCYEQVVRARERDPRAWYRLGIVRLQTGDADGALEAMQRVIALEPELVAAHARSGHLQLDSGGIEQAAHHIERALELDPDHEVSLIGLVRLHLERRQPDEAIALLQQKRLLERDNRGYAHRLLAAAHRQMGDLPAAQRALARAGDRRLSWPDPHARELAGLKAGARNRRTVARAMMRRGQYAEAIPLLVQASREDPGNPRILNTLATCQLEVGQFTACIATLREALKLDPDNYWTNVSLAQAQWVMSRSQTVDLADALEHAEHAIRLQPELAQAWVTKGRILMNLQRPAEAVDALKRAFAIDARDPSILTQAGFLECDLERWAQAIETLETAADHDRISATPLVGLARACMGLGDLECAEAALEAARDRRIDHPQLLEEAERGLRAMQAES